MSIVHLAFAPSAAAHASALSAALRALGYDATGDAARLHAAKAVVVLWSADALASAQVRAEAAMACDAAKIVQLNLDDCALPLPFGQFPALSLRGWTGEGPPPEWPRIAASIAAVSAVHASAPPAAAPAGPLGGQAAAREPPPEAQPKAMRLAVLPFDNLSNDADLGYFSDGVSEEVLYAVAAIDGLQVVGRTSSFRFRGAEKSVKTVAAALGVTHVLDGSVRRAGQRIRIHVELVEAATLTMLFSQRFDRPLTDVFALQDEIAAGVAAALNQHFAPPRAVAAVDPRAYDLYLQARAVYARDLDWAAQEKCVALLEDAVARDPDFARAWGLLAMYHRGEASLAAARRGLELDDNCPTALMAMAFSKPPFAEHGEKLDLARRAYELAPDEQIVAGAYVVLLVAAGFVGDAFAISARRVERDPLSPLVAGGHAVLARALGRASEAVALADRTVQAFPEAGYGKFVRALLAIYDNDIAAARTVASAASATGQPLPLEIVIMFMEAVAAMDAGSRAMVVRQFLNRLAPNSYVVDIGMAAALGETTLAMDHLLDAIRAGRPLEFTAENDGRAGGNDIAITSGLFLPNCEALRRDPRFAEACVRLGLHALWLGRGQWPDCAAEVAPIYDLRAECAAAAARLAA